MAKDLQKDGNEATTDKKVSSARKRMEEGRREETNRVIAYIEKNGNMPADDYNNIAPKSVGTKMPFTAESKYSFIHNAVMTGCHNEKNGNCYVPLAAIESDKSSMELKDNVEAKPTMQCYWDKPKYGAKDKSYFIKMVNAAKLKKFVSHNKEISDESLDKVIEAIEKKVLKNMDNVPSKEGLAYYDAAKDIAHVPKTDDKLQYAKDLIYMAASREALKETVRTNDIKFHNRDEGSKEERLMLKHFLACELRMKLQLGADSRNGFGREASASRKNAINLLKRDEKMLSNIERRAAGIAYAMEQEYFNGMIKDKDTKKATKEQNKGNDITDSVF